MSKLNCAITVYGNMGHTQQILTGYFLLKRQGLVNLTAKVERSNFGIGAKAYHIKVVLEEEIIIYYDLTDGYEIDMVELDKVNVYFKRSYLKSYVDLLDKSESHKIFELGMNYCVFPNSIDIDNIVRSLSFYPLKTKVSALLKALNLPALITNSPKLKNIESFPSLKDKTNKKILFMARTWDPAGDKNKFEEIVEINETRANCIRALRKEFGSEFQGGVSDTKYTRDNYKDCIFKNTKLTRKNEYLKYLKEFPICIASTGLHGSIGWKLGEYVSMSKAIVTEKLQYSLPGGFINQQNYLEFGTVDECVEETLELYQNDNKRFKMMNDNALYYNKYLKSDSLVLNSIIEALSLPKLVLK